jgi:hypothetical protein
MRRFLLHVLPSSFHRIRHCGLLANANREHDIATARDLLHQPAPTPPAESGDDADQGGPRPTGACHLEASYSAPSGRYSCLLVGSHNRKPYLR